MAHLLWLLAYPAGFHFDYRTLGIPEAVDIYVSYPIERGDAIWPSSSGHGHPVRMLARLREGVTVPLASEAIFDPERGPLATGRSVFEPIWGRERRRTCDVAVTESR